MRKYRSIHWSPQGGEDDGWQQLADEVLAEAERMDQQDKQPAESTSPESNGHAQRPPQRPALKLLSPASDAIPGIDTEDGWTETAQAQRFVERYRQDLRYCGPWHKWLVFDGCRWAIDQEHIVEARAKTVALGLWPVVAKLAAGVDPSNVQGAIKYVRAMLNARGISNTVTLARSEPGMSVLPEQISAQPRGPQHESGAGGLRPGRRLPRLACVPRTHLRQLLLAHRLRASRDRHEPHGRGPRARAVLLLRLALLGDDYAIKANHDLLMAKKGEQHPTELARLHGKRLVACVEAGEGRRFHESLVKELTGGDTVTARRMREDFWSFEATHKVWLAANHRPTIRGTDDGIWRRVKLIPFTVRIPDDEQDPALKDKLKAELPGILTWALTGVADWQVQGLIDPPEVREATAEYRAASDVIAMFLDECCVMGPTCKVRSKDLYAEYNSWCETNGEQHVNLKRFGEAMTEKEFERRTSNGTWYIGLGLAAEESQ
jgi:putative DNA primase/helicase